MGLDMYIEKVNENGEKELMYYYRKFNALYGYFDEKYSLDNPGTVAISSEDVEDIIDRLEKVIQTPNKASVYFPVSYGPFFGTYEYGDIYFQYIHEALNDFYEIRKNISKEKYIFSADY